MSNQQTLEQMEQQEALVEELVALLTEATSLNQKGRIQAQLTVAESNLKIKIQDELSAMNSQMKDAAK